jgi:hypothetical protein
VSRALLRSPAFWLGLVLLATGLLNGIGPYLRRTGLIEKERYEKFWDLHTGPSGFTTAPLGLGRRCVVHRSIEHGGADPAGGGPPARYVFAVRPWEVPAKLAKDLLVVALVAGSVVAWRRGGGRLSLPEKTMWPLLALAALVAWQAAAGLLRGDPLTVLAGLRSFGFLAIALTAAWVRVETFERVVPWLVGLLAIQLLLVPLELLRGIPVQGHLHAFGEFFPRRASGTFVMPNSLGVFAASVVALAAGFGATDGVRRLAWVLGGLVVVVSGSASGLVMLAAVGVAQALFVHRPVPWGRLATLGVLTVAAGFALFLGRPDVLDSAAARVQGTAAVLNGPLPSVVFGRGIGLGTNASFQAHVGLERFLPAARTPAIGGDSAVSSLMLQTGVIGVTLFFAALGLAWRRCHDARPLVGALGLAALTLNVPEAFPVSILLGLVLAPGARPTPASTFRRR